MILINTVAVAAVVADAAGVIVAVADIVVNGGAAAPAPAAGAAAAAAAAGNGGISGLASDCLQKAHPACCSASRRPDDRRIAKPSASVPAGRQIAP